MTRTYIKKIKTGREVMDDESGEWMEPVAEVPLVGLGE